MGVDIKDKPIQHIDLSDLQLDQENPRFAEFVPKHTTQRDIVNTIVKQFGVDDVLSSIAVSGYFSAEPLVCKSLGNGKYVVVEGNRRLAAMLILSNDERAKDHAQRIERYQLVHEEHNFPAFNPVPSIVFDENDTKESLLSYLGVRHIVSTKQWDSFAKAAWVSTALNTSTLNLDDIAEMIGDNRGTIQRLLSGFHFIKQLQKEGRFDPESSIRKGRGSNTKYPFSWIYTILGSTSVQNFVDLSKDPTEENPIPNEKLDKASLLVRSMFGDSNKGVNPAINDSRQLSDLARIVASNEKVVYLTQGKTVEEIDRLTQPLEDLLATAMVETLGRLREITARIGEEELSAAVAEQLFKSSQAISKQASILLKQITDAKG